MELWLGRTNRIFARIRSIWIRGGKETLLIITTRFIGVKLQSEGVIGKCIYCGTIGKTTRDHIPPKNLFPQPWPNNFMTVPCCENCNSGFSRDDEYFRLMVACNENTSSNPQAQQLWNKKIIRQLRRRGGSAISELIRQSFGDAVNIDQEKLHCAEMRVTRTLVRIVKGLYFIETNQLLDDEFDVRVNLSPDFELSGGLDKTLLYIKSDSRSNGRIIGNGVFQYIVTPLPGQENVFIFILLFYEKLAFLCLVAPKGYKINMA